MLLDNQAEDCGTCVASLARCSDGQEGGGRAGAVAGQRPPEAHPHFLRALLSSSHTKTSPVTPVPAPYLPHAFIAADAQGASGTENVGGGGAERGVSSPPTPRAKGTSPDPRRALFQPPPHTARPWNSEAVTEAVQSYGSQVKVAANSNSSSVYHTHVHCDVLQMVDTGCPPGAELREPGQVAAGIAKSITTR